MKKQDKKNPNNLKNFGWSNMYLNRILKKEVEIGGYGTQRYVIKNGKNKGKVL